MHVELNHINESLRSILLSILRDLEKSDKGNLDATKRIRVKSIALAKLMKIYRKDTVLYFKKVKQDKQKKL